LRIRFDERELVLLRGAEQVRGAALAHAPRPALLRSALNLAKAGRKLSVATAGASVSLEEGELNLLLEALHYATEEIQHAARPAGEHDAGRRAAVLIAFPELVDHAWKTFGVVRELEALRARMRTALQAQS
jgi:hypothetical protein